MAIDYFSPVKSLAMLASVQIAQRPELISSMNAHLNKILMKQWEALKNCLLPAARIQFNGNVEQLDTLFTGCIQKCEREYEDMDRHYSLPLMKPILLFRKFAQELSRIQIYRSSGMEEVRYPADPFQMARLVHQIHAISNAQKLTEFWDVLCSQNPEFNAVNLNFAEGATSQETFFNRASAICQCLEQTAADSPMQQMQQRVRLDLLFSQSAASHQASEQVRYPLVGLPEEIRYFRALEFLYLTEHAELHSMDYSVLSALPSLKAIVHIPTSTPLSPDLDALIAQTFSAPPRGFGPLHEIRSSAFDIPKMPESFFDPLEEQFFQMPLLQPLLEFTLEERREAEEEISQQLHASLEEFEPMIPALCKELSLDRSTLTTTYTLGVLAASFIRLQNKKDISLASAAFFATLDRYIHALNEQDADGVLSKPISHYRFRSPLAAFFHCVFQAREDQVEERFSQLSEEDKENLSELLNGIFYFEKSDVFSGMSMTSTPLAARGHYNLQDVLGALKNFIHAKRSDLEPEQEAIAYRFLCSELTSIPWGHTSDSTGYDYMLRFLDALDLATSPAQTAASSSAQS